MNIRRLRRILLSLCLLAIVIITYTGFRINHYASQFSDRPSDAAIILGAAIQQDKPSPVFQARIDHGVDLYHGGKVKVLIFTGGIGAGKTLAEAEVAKTYAITQGVSSKDIFTESQSRITYENLQEAKILLDAAQLETVLLISDPLHMKRAMTMAEDLNIKASSSPTPFSRYQSRRTRTGFLVREIFYYSGYLLFK